MISGQLSERVAIRAHFMCWAERFHRYRIVDAQTIELIPSPTIAVHSRVFQNREILGLFEQFRSSKSFVGRDQVREALFVK